MKKNEGSRRQLTPLMPHQCGGKWVAWSLDGQVILGAADTLAEVQDLGKQQGRPEVAFEWVPPADQPFIGLGSV